MDKKQFIENICHWTYARQSHWQHFEGMGIELYGEKVDKNTARLKTYQDLLIMMMMKIFIPSGTRILEVGGGASRILRHFSKTHECWNIDKFEGLGNGRKRRKCCRSHWFWQAPKEIDICHHDEWGITLVI